MHDYFLFCYRGRPKSLSVSKIAELGHHCCHFREDHVRFWVQPRGVRKTYCARSRNDVRRLTSRSNGMPSKKLIESLEDVCLCRNCSKARPNVSR